MHIRGYIALATHTVATHEHSTLKSPNNFIQTSKIKLEESDNIQFSFLNATIRTEKTVKPKIQNSLVIQIQGEVKTHDSASEAARYSRPTLLVTLGILSFFSGRDFTVYQITESSSNITTRVLPQENLVARCIFNGSDHSKDIKTLCNNINNKTPHQNALLFSLLDRWRKAQSQLIESEGQGLLEDESLLSFFHVLELLSTEYSPTQKLEADEKISSFLDDLVTNTFKYSGPSAKQKISEKTKLITSILANGDLFSIASKINYMLEKLNLLDDRTKNLVQKLVQARNSIAHGRQVFIDRFIWPLPPFFMLHSDLLNLGEIIRTFTARIIAKHYGLEHWQSEWIESLSTISPPPHVIKTFISNGDYKKIDTENFHKGTIDLITPSSITEAYINKHISFPDFEQTMGGHTANIMASTPETSDTEPLYIAIFLADAQSPLLADLCRRHIQDNYASTSTLKDCLRFLEYYGIDTPWFREWVATGINRKTE